MFRTSGPVPWAGFEHAYFGFAFACLLSLPQAADSTKAIGEMRKLLLILVFSTSFGAALSGGMRRIVTGCLIGAGALVAVAGPLKTLFLQGTWERTSGFFSLPLTFAECQMIFIIITLRWLMMPQESPRNRWLLGGALVMQMFGFFAAFTRGAVIGLVLGVLSMFRRSPRALVAVLCVTVLSIGGLAVLQRSMSNRQDAFDTSAATPDGLKNIRLRIWSIGLNILTKHPVFGVGMNNVKSHYRDRVTPAEREKNWIYGHLHNTFLQILTMTGMFGLVTFFWFWAAISKWCLMVAANDLPLWERGMADAAFPVIVAFLGSGLTEYSFGDEEVAMLAFFSIGLLTNAYRDFARGKIAPASEPIEKTA
ncbi:MAG TPA: O-antigen ligase family protein [Candidatus Ozemobacteraceae bacterium]|nr:O-antigen ligase family protein [Candidatus Ozemobacteraceae bacterium]